MRPIRGRPTATSDLFNIIETMSRHSNAYSRSSQTLPRVSAEMSLQALAYNMKRVINLIGMRALIEAVRATQGVKLPDKLRAKYPD